MWTPTNQGQYKVTATFVGDDSYGSSHAQNYVGVTQAPTATATATISFDALYNNTSTDFII
jgi:hypothetical protein